MIDFNVSSGRLFISDPSYTPNDESLADIVGNEKAKNGQWSAWCEYEESEGRVAQLHAYIPVALNGCIREKFITVGVDSGQMGIFDSNKWEDSNEYSGTKFHNKFDSFGSSLWYDVCCNITCNTDEEQENKSFGNMDGGVVCSTGYGDGSYDCVLGFDKDDFLVSVSITFIEEDEDTCWSCSYFVDNCVCGDDCENCGESEDYCSCCHDCDEANNGSCTCDDE